MCDPGIQGRNVWAGDVNLESAAFIYTLKVARAHQGCGCWLREDKGYLWGTPALGGWGDTEKPEEETEIEQH